MKCPTCGSWRCDKCGADFRFPPTRLPVPFGSLNAAAPIEVCEPCYQDYAMLGWKWLGREVPPRDVLFPGSAGTS